MDKQSTSSTMQFEKHPKEEVFKTIYRSKQTAALQENQQRKKRELSQLNDRFASYIERVRFLEGQNKKLQIEINHLRDKWGSNTNTLKDKYEIEIHEARHLIDDTAKDRAAAELRAKRIEEELIHLKEKYKSLLTGRDSDREKIQLLEKELLNNEADLHLLHRRLIDLEDERQRFDHQSKKLILDYERLTKDLDHETFIRIQLENQKQTLSEEIEFLKDLHLIEIEEIKQMNLFDRTFENKEFFENQLANAIRNIRREYEQLNDQQRNELQLWYQRKVTQAIQEVQSHQAIRKIEKTREQEEIRKLKELVLESQENISRMRRRNEELENRIIEFENQIENQRIKNLRANEERDWKIKELRSRLDHLGRDYDELISAKTSIQSEISIYRKLLEGEEEREGLKQLTSSIAMNSSVADVSTTYPRSNRESQNQSVIDYDISTSSEVYHLPPRSVSIEQEITDKNKNKRLSSLHGYQSDSYDQSLNNNRLMLTSYVPYQPMSPIRITEPTIFDQVYGNSRLRQRPNSINLNAQWLPITDHASIHRWTPNDINYRKLKTRTCFETDFIRDQAPSKAATPPSSDYTDAYLSAFSPKPLPTKRIYRLAAPVFANVVPIQTLSSMNNSIKTSDTRFNPVNTFQPSLSNPSSTSSSSFVPDTFPKSKSSPVPNGQLFVSNNKTEKPFETTHSSLPRVSPFVIPPPYQSKSPYENVDKSKISSESSSLPNNTSSTPEKQPDRPNTLIFQRDEDMHSSSIEKPSPILTPAIESKTDSENPSADELATMASKPIQILEKTVKKYDSIIDQISDILAGVSPLSSTVDSMSPSKSALDYELTSEGSPILQRKHTDTQPSQQSSTTVKTIVIQQMKGKHLIRDDSYDKIITAIADLDKELSPQPEKQNLTTTVIEEEKDIPITQQDEQTTGEVSSNEPEELPVPVSHEVNKEIISDKKNEKRVSWGETVTEDSNDESTLSETTVNTDETEKLVANKELPVVGQQIPPTIPSEPSSSDDEKFVPTKFAVLSTTKHESLDISSSISDSNELPTTSTDINESHSSSESGDDTQFVLSANIQQPPIVESPIETLANTISTRFISNDVYHGYLGDHTQFTENISNLDDTDANSKLSLLVSLRRTIATPATPLIEAIQSVVSSMRSVTALEPLRSLDEVLPEEDVQNPQTTEETITMSDSHHDAVTESTEDVRSNSEANIQETQLSSEIESLSKTPSFTQDQNLVFTSPPLSSDNHVETSRNANDQTIIIETLSSDSMKKQVIEEKINSLPIIEEHQSSTETIQFESSSFQEKEHISSRTKSQVSDDGITQSTVNQQAIDDTMITENMNTLVESENPLMTELRNESMSLTDHEIIYQIVHDIIQSILTQLQETFPITQIDDVTQPSTTSNQTNYLLELSSANTDLDSLELIRALRGHSIRLPDSLEQSQQVPEKSSSTTTSSRVTSSDRYVSYAIHQMGDSSQERLPALPLAADIPIYKTVEESNSSKPKILPKQPISKDDDLTEFDATDNLTSYSDELILQRLEASAVNQDKQLDASSTDEDVDDEIEQHDLTDLEQIIDKLNQPILHLSLNEEPYHHYELATTPSSNESSSSSSKRQPDDVYFIPGYAGLWRPSADNNKNENQSENLSAEYDADDERNSSIKTRTIVRTLNSTKRPLSLNPTEHLVTGIPLRPDTINFPNRLIPEHVFDQSESDSYQTCPSSISKPLEKISTDSSDESIFLIREHERGVSLPISMKIDFDDLAIRLSTSSPIDNKFYSKTLQNLSSPSTHSEPPLPTQIDSNSRESSPSLNEQQKLPSWLNTTNIITNGPSQITYQKSSKGPISISKCHPQGYYILLENTSRSKTIDLTNWKIYQENDTDECLDFIFLDQYILKPNHSLKIFTNTYQSNKLVDDQIISTISSWLFGPNIHTILIDPDGKDCATLIKKTINS